MLTNITGDPMYANLAKLERECKVSAKTIRTTIDGGNKRHLSIVCTPAAYARTALGTPTKRPVLPAPLNPIGTADQLSIAATLYNAQLEEFNKCKQIELMTVYK